MLGAGDDLTQALTRRFSPAIPLADLARQLIAESGQLLNPFLERGEMTVRQIENARAWRRPGSTQLQNLGDLIERKPERLRLFDELQLLDGPFRIAAVCSIGRASRAR